MGDTTIKFKDFSLEAALLADNVGLLDFGLKDMPANFHRLTQSASDAALEIALLTDSVEPLLKLAADERWSAIGKSIEGAFLTVTDTFSKIVDGVLQGTTDIEKAFKDLGLKILANFNQFAVHQVFDPFLKAAASFATDLAKAFETGDWTAVSSSFSKALVGTPLGALFGIDPNAPGSGMPGMGPFAEGAQVFDIGNLLNAQTIIAGIAVLMNSIALMAQGKVATGLGTLVGGILGGVVGGFATGGTPIGIGVGAAAGSAVGGLLGSLFEEDWAALRRIREQQRTRTAEAVTRELSGDILTADDKGELAQVLKKSLGGTLSSMGGVLLAIAERETEFAIDPAAAHKVEGFLRSQGFEMEEFTQGRINSIKELVSKSGEAFQEIIEGLAQFLDIMTDVTATVTELQGLSVEEFTENFHRLFEVLDVARMLEELGFDQAAHKLRTQLKGIIAAMGDPVEIIAQITEAASKMVRADPTQLLRFVNVEQWKRAGEEIEDTTDRIRESLTLVRDTMNAMDTELRALKPPLEGATLSLQEANQAALDANWDKLVEDLTSTDPSKWGEALVQAHDLLVDRYQAEMAVIQQIVGAIEQLNTGATALVNTASRLQDLGILPKGGLELASKLALERTAQVGTFAFPEMNLMAGRGAVEIFAQQSMMAAKALDTTAMEAAMKAAAQLLDGFTASLDQINKIEDPSKRMAMLTELLAQVTDATEAAAAAAVAYWTGLHNLVSGMMEDLDGLAANLAKSGNVLAKNAGWLSQAGVDIGDVANQMFSLIDIFPTMTAKIELLGSGMNLFIASLEGAEMERLDKLGKKFAETPEGSEQRADITAQITNALAPVLTAIAASTTAAMKLADPGQRLDALTAIMDMVGGLLASLPPDMAAALTAIFGPEIQNFVNAMITAGAEQAAQAKAVAAQLEAIIKPSGALSPENFLLNTVKGINDAMTVIITNAAPLFEKITSGMELAGEAISAAIKEAGAALAKALDGFATPASQLASALSGLATTMATTMTTAITTAIESIFSAETGLPYVPKTGLYQLHQGEAVLTAEENAVFMRGAIGSFQAGTGLVSRIASAIVAAIGPALKDFQGFKVDLGFLSDAWRIAGEAWGKIVDSNDRLVAGMTEGWAVAGQAFGQLMASNEALAARMDSGWAVAGQAFGQLMASNEALGAKVESGWAIAGEAFGAVMGAISSLATVISTALTAAGVAPPMFVPGTFTAVPEKGPDVTKSDAWKAMHPSAEHGLDAVPRTGLYLLHQGEGVLTASQNKVLGSYQEGTLPSFGDPGSFSQGGPGISAGRQARARRDAGLSADPRILRDAGQPSGQPRGATGRNREDDRRGDGRDQGLCGRHHRRRRCARRQRGVAERHVDRLRTAGGVDGQSQHVDRGSGHESQLCPVRHASVGRRDRAGQRCRGPIGGGLADCGTDGAEPRRGGLQTPRRRCRGQTARPDDGVHHAGPDGPDRGDRRQGIVRPPARRAPGHEP